jgi:hypothetical protein
VRSQAGWRVVRLARPLAGWQARRLEVRPKLTTPIGRASDLLRTWAVYLERIHQRSARLSLTPAVLPVPIPIRTLFPFNPLGFSACSLRRL